MAEKYFILVVDNDENIRSTIEEMLEFQGYHVLHAESPERALALIQTNTFDAFLLDLEMKGMGGIELCRRIRSIDKFKLTPIIFLTASGEHLNVSEAFSAGCDDFIDKPFNHLILRARLKGRLEKMKYFQQVERTRQTINKYLSARTLEMVEKASKTGVVPSPEDRDLAICFTDIRGFTAFAENLPPRQLFSILSSHLSEQVTTVHEHGGYVDKFGGDGIMALFDGKDMVLQSCLCALKIIGTGQARSASGSLPVGIGIHAGRATIGNIGSPEHLDYSAIGSAVNLAARLCGQAEPGSIAVSKAVFDAVSSDSRLRFYNEREVRIKGLKEPVTVYTLTSAL